MKRALLCAVLAASALAGAISAAQAEDGQMRVKLGDLDLATTDGAKVALARIQTGAAVFCDVEAGRQTLERAAVENRCVAEMTRKSVQALNAPRVAALLSGKPDGARSVLALAQK